MLTQGLKGIVAAQTKISHIDGEKGNLFYRGFEIRNIAKKYTFEEIAFLLWYGDFPSKSQLHHLKCNLKENRELSLHSLEILNKLPKEMNVMSVIRTVISAEGLTQYNWKPTISEAIRLTALIPTIIAYRKRKVEGKAVIKPSNEYNHVENYLYMLTGVKPQKTHVDALETYMILTCEHSMNASTFSARVTISTESDMVSAVTAAIGTMKGPLHGGAPSGVIDLLNQIRTRERATSVIKEKILSGERLMGFGHRIYKTCDPRALALREKLQDLGGQDNWLDLAVHVENTAVQVLNELKPGRSLYTNVEYYAAAIMKSIDMDSELFTPTFTASRIVGWTAHILEQSENNTIYRPECEYIGHIR